MSVDRHGAVTTDPLDDRRAARCSSRLLLGTGGFRSLEEMAAAIEASGTELVTVALRRVDPAQRGSIIDVLDAAGVELLPNTAGCFTARDAVTDRAARARGVRDRLGQARGDRRRPHAAARRAGAARGRRGARRRRLRRAALHERRPDPRAPPGGRRLRRGDAARLADRLGHGAAATRTTCASSASAPACRSILDAGVGTASDAALAMELGCDAVLCASAVSRAEDPTAMARAIRARRRGRPARRRAGRIPRRLHAEASTPEDGLAGSSEPATHAAARRCSTRWERAWSGRDPKAFDPLCHPRRPLRGPADAASRSRARRRCAPRTPSAVGGVPRRARPADRPAALTDGTHRERAGASSLGTHRGAARRAAGDEPLRRRARRSSSPSCATSRLFRVRAFFDVYDAAVTLGVLPRAGTLGEKALLMLRGFGLRSRG